MRHAVTLALLLASCSSATDAPPEATPDPTVLSQPIATGLKIEELALMQNLKVPVAKGGQPAPRGRVQLVAGRDALLRVYVTLDAGWAPKPITARIKLVADSPTGGFIKVLSATKTVSRPSSEADLDSTINVPIPGQFLQTASRFVVVLNADQGTPPGDAPMPARYPANGSLAPLDASPGAEKVKVKLVPVQYGADGSNRLPDMSAEQIERYRQILYKLYPTARVDITVHAPFPWNEPISGSGKGLGALLEAIGNLRRSEDADLDVYYYGAFNAAQSFEEFCRGGCTTGLSPTGAAYSVGVGFGGSREQGERTAETAAHEIGHAHGLNHAPCGGAGGPDPGYPTGAEHAQARIGVWGYDQIANKLVDPGGSQPPKDLMSYCNPSWISDYHHQKLFERVRGNNDFRARMMSAQTPRQGEEHRAFRVEGDGTITRRGQASRERYLERGEPRDLTWKAGDGSTLGHGTARFFPYDHLPGGVLWVPLAPEGAITAELDGFTRPERVHFLVR